MRNIVDTTKHHTVCTFICDLMGKIGFYNNKDTTLLSTISVNPDVEKADS